MSRYDKKKEKKGGPYPFFIPFRNIVEAKSGHLEVDHQDKPGRRFCVHCKSFLTNDWPPTVKDYLPKITVSIVKNTFSSLEYSPTSGFP